MAMTHTKLKSNRNNVTGEQRNCLVCFTFTYTTLFKLYLVKKKQKKKERKMKKAFGLFDLVKGE